MYDPGERLFCRRSIVTGDRIVYEGLSVRYTIIALLGLARLAAAGGRSPVDIEAAIPGLVGRVGQSRDIGDTGLLLWLLALSDPDGLPSRIRGMQLQALWESYRESRADQTMELSWFLTGLSLAARACRGGPAASLSAIAGEVYRLLRGNCGRHGIFGHRSRGPGPGRIRARIGSFADQVYPIYALSRYGEVFDNREAVKTALDCAARICRLQGPRGQWWWHYDRESGRAIGRYPVYSVHQDGMAPMALAAAGRAGGRDFSKEIDSGLDWIVGANELGRDLIDRDRKLIWRSFYQGRFRRYVGEAAAILGLEEIVGPGLLKILYECRPYHLGWVLYAFA